MFNLYKRKKEKPREPDVCIWKKSYLNGGTSFQDVKEGHELYKCIHCTDYVENSKCDDYKGFLDLYRKAQR